MLEPLEGALEAQQTPSQQPTTTNMTQPLEITSLFNYLQSKQSDIIRMMEAVEEVDKLNAKPEKPKKSARSMDRIKLLVAMVNDLRKQGMTTQKACDSLGIPLSTHNCRLKRLSTAKKPIDRLV